MINLVTVLNQCTANYYQKLMKCDNVKQNKNQKIVKQKDLNLVKWPYLLWSGLLCSQADYNHHNQSNEGQQDREVQVMDIFQHLRPVVLFIAQRLGVNEVQQHADAAHQQAESQAPECTLRERRVDGEHNHTIHHPITAGLKK